MEFELDIERAGERYRAKVRQAPVGEGAKSELDLPTEDDLEEIGRELIRLRHLMIDAPRRGGSAKVIGKSLFESVFTGSVLEAWRASIATAQGSLLLRLRLDEDTRLLRVPWELLFDPRQREFVAIEMRVVRTLDLPVRVEGRSLSGPPPLRILVILSSPPDVAPLATKQEWAVLDGALGDKVELKLVDPRLEDVDRTLKSGAWDVLHFVGHGRADDEGGFLILEDCHGGSQAVDHLQLGTFLGNRSLRLVVLNACEGARPGESDAFSGVAQALIGKGVPAVVAMQQPISDAAAITFAKDFYRALAEEQTVGMALRRGREALFRKPGAEWAVPVLYLNGLDEPVIKSPLPSPSRLWIFATSAAVLLLLAIFGLSIVNQPDPKPASQGLLSIKPPRGSEGNPDDCLLLGDLEIAFVKIDRGLFEMGEKKESQQVRITEPFCLSVYEVTQELWSRILDKPNPPPDQLYLPVQDVTFEEVQQFFDRLNEVDPSGHYRFPTEAEWEYAARARSRTRYFFGEDKDDLSRYGNCKGGEDGFAELAPVGQLKPNDFGLYDMYGNVSEWVSDRHDGYSGKPVNDPPGPQEGTKRIRRGGGWDSSARTCSSAARSIVQPNRSDKFTGFRIVREIR